MYVHVQKRLNLLVTVWLIDVFLIIYKTEVYGTEE